MGRTRLRVCHLKEYFGMYSIFGKAYCTDGGRNKFFGEIARILMEYAFAHTNPTSMSQNKAAIIFREYQGGTMDWGILNSEGVCAALESFQSGKRFLPVLAHYLTILYPPPSSRPHLSAPTTTEATREDLGLDPGRMGGHHTRLISLVCSQPYPHRSNTSTENTKAKGVARDPCRMG